MKHRISLRRNTFTFLATKEFDVLLMGLVINLFKWEWGNVIQMTSQFSLVWGMGSKYKCSCSKYRTEHCILSKITYTLNVNFCSEQSPVCMYIVTQFAQCEQGRLTVNSSESSQAIWPGSSRPVVQSSYVWWSRTTQLAVYNLSKPVSASRLSSLQFVHGRCILCFGWLDASPPTDCMICLETLFGQRVHLTKWNGRVRCEYTWIRENNGSADRPRITMLLFGVRFSTSPQCILRTSSQLNSHWAKPPKNISQSTLWV